MAVSRLAASLSPSPTLAITQRVAQLKAEGIRVISLGEGEPDFSTSPSIRRAALEAMDTGKTRYTPSSGIPELKEAICRKLAMENGLQYETKNILVSNGAKHAAWNGIFSLIDPGDEAIVLVPFWVSYTEQIKSARGVPVFVPCAPENGFEPRLEDIEASITPRTKLLIINSPNNPSGAVYSEHLLKDLAQLAARHDLWVISDEIYEKMTYDGARHCSIASFIPERTVVVNGLSKAFAMTGWRIGYAAAPEPVIHAMRSLQEQITSCPNSIAQYASLAAFGIGKEEILSMRNELWKRRDFMADRLNRISGVHCARPPGALYLFADVRELTRPSGFSSSDELTQTILEEAQVAVVSGTAFGMDGFLRLSFAKSLSEIEEALNRIDRRFPSTR